VVVAATWQARLGHVVGASGSPRADLLLAAAVLGFAVLLRWESAKIPPPFFDPLGSAAVPNAIALVLAVLAAILALRALAALGPGDGAESLPFRRRPDVAVGIYVLCVAYVAVMDVGWLAFGPATLLFLVAAAALLGRLHGRTLLTGTAVAVVVAFGCAWLFTRFFFIDLPT
jgi:putative tricarboxylic transport membrane protein